MRLSDIAFDPRKPTTRTATAVTSTMTTTAPTTTRTTTSLAPPPPAVAPAPAPRQTQAAPPLVELATTATAPAAPLRTVSRTPTAAARAVATGGTIKNTGGGSILPVQPRLLMDAPKPVDVWNLIKPTEETPVPDSTTTMTEQPSSPPPAEPTHINPMDPGRGSFPVGNGAGAEPVLRVNPDSPLPVMTLPAQTKAKQEAEGSTLPAGVKYGLGALAVGAIAWAVYKFKNKQ